MTPKILDQENKKIEIKIPTDLNCETCEILNEIAFLNCTQTYRECRNFNKNLWNRIDKQLNKIRKEIFDDILTFNPFSKID